MKKILFVATSNMKKRTGGGLANLAYYNSLKDRYGDNVDLVAFEESMPNFQSVLHIKRLSRLDKILMFFKGIIHRFSPVLGEFILNHKSEYSMVIFNGGLLGDVVEKVSKSGLKLVTIHHNYEVEFQMDNKKSTTLWGLSSYWVKRNENKAYKYSDINLFLTEDDLELFKKKYGGCHGKTEIIGVYEPCINKYTPNTNPPVLNHIVISGSLNSFQTTAGIQDLDANYMRVIKQVYNDDFVLTITGRRPTQRIWQFANNYPQVSIVENPEDIYSVVKQNGIYLCPTNIGGGLKLRVMDGLSQGLPILVHKTSARGYNMFFDKPWFQVYNDSISFERALLSLVEYIRTHEGQEIHKTIQDEFMNYFSYINGSRRLINALYD